MHRGVLHVSTQAAVATRGWLLPATRQRRTVKAYSPHAMHPGKTGGQLESASPDEAAARGLATGRNAGLAKPLDVFVGYLNLSGELCPAEDVQYARHVKAVFNRTNRRVELVLEEQGHRLVAWVKGGQYLAHEVDKVDPLSEFWDPERIDNEGGVLLMPQLGRIPGEAAQTITIADAVQYMMSYRLDTPLGSFNVQWQKADERVTANSKWHRRAVVNVTIACFVLILCQAAYFWVQWLERRDELSAVTTHSSPTLNK
ncbi:hypothetical protein DIPPA_27885 [Diplonema papillatum]|nr:hypothetical protein DIPPA_27885 [Diplonema papillatum]